MLGRARGRHRIFISPLPGAAYHGRVRRLLLLLVLAASLGLAENAAAQEVVLNDDQGRTMRFDVQAEGVDPEWYAALLRAAPHGDEISTVTVRIVSWEALRSACGRGAAGCYNRNRMVVPAEQSEDNAHTVVHEYAHHLDRTTPVAGAREPNGTPHWWRARSMAELARIGSVARDYSIDWSRSIAEIFAEDYARLALGQTRYKIPWLGEPDETVLDAIEADLGLGPPPAIVRPPALKPVTLDRRGTLTPQARATLTFGLLGPGRRVTATATLAGRATLEVRCGGSRVALRTMPAGTTKVTIDRRGLGPADCTTTLTSNATARRAYTLVVRLSIPRA
jgi:hypothetical protein